MAFGIFFFLECHPLNNEDGRCNDLKTYGEGNEEDPESRTEFYGMMKLVSICCKEGNVH